MHLINRGQNPLPLHGPEQSQNIKIFMWGVRYNFHREYMGCGG